MPPQNAPSVDRLGQLIYDIHGQRVMLDFDLAAIYGVPTRRLNEQVRRNLQRFPKDFAFQLTAKETLNLKSQIATAATNAAGIMRSQFATASKRNIRYRPWAFTEHGAVMAANVLRSQSAVQMSIFVIRAFVKMRERLATNAAILRRLAEIDNTLLLHDSALRDVYKKLLPLLAPSSASTKKRIGFHS